jgi:hypothetical protein
VGAVVRLLEAQVPAAVLAQRRAAARDRVVPAAECAAALVVPKAAECGVVRMAVPAAPSRVVRPRAVLTAPAVPVRPPATGMALAAIPVRPSGADATVPRPSSAAGGTRLARVSAAIAVLWETVAIGVDVTVPAVPGAVVPSGAR